MHSMCVRARVAPSGTVYLPSYYTDLGFKPVPAAEAFSDGPGAALAAAAREKVRSSTRGGARVKGKILRPFYTCIFYKFARIYVLLSWIPYLLHLRCRLERNLSKKWGGAACG
jgi:hypothetical protein